MAQPLTDAIDALTTYANTVTGKTPPDTTLSDAVATLAAGYGGGGSIGGLSEMVDVNSQDYQLAYMLMQMKKGETAGGKVTYPTAFTNTKTKILETGLEELHGILFVDHSKTLSNCKAVFIFAQSNDTYDVVGFNGGNVNRVYGQAADVVSTGNALQGGVSFDGGDVYYTGRYNQSASYQMLTVGVEYEWIAW